MFQTKVVEKIKTHFRVINLFLSKIVPLSDDVEKYSSVREATGLQCCTYAFHTG
jgi:hypothetical protein